MRRILLLAIILGNISCKKKHAETQSVDLSRDTISSELSQDSLIDLSIEKVLLPEDKKLHAPAAADSLKVIFKDGKKNTTTKKEKKTKEQPETLDLSKVKPDYSDPKTTENTSLPKKKKEEEMKTEIAFKRNFYSFGEVMEGDTVAFKFTYSNIGDHPLFIKKATATCGCTHPSFSFLPVAPGEKGSIEGFYVSTGKKGPQNPMVKVVANTIPDEEHKLYLDGIVIPSDKKEKSKEETIVKDSINE